ncbi:MAG: biopolymer transporter ExbD [Bacteroidales bacterium]|jgi:biopolymer transport protein ExbD|nr:biopolymer transporter ExbD [Bacteroidales bacterium]
MANLKKTPQINAASMADISFILFIFFLMVTTMGTDYGLIRQLPPMSDVPNEGTEINKRNVFVVSINQHNNLMVRGEYKDISQLREMAKDFFDLRNAGDEYPEKIQEDLPLIGLTTINKTAVVSLQNDRGTSYKTYIQAQNELAGAVHELRDEFCLQKFGKKYDDCTQEQQDVVGKDVFPMAISEAEPKDISKTKK